MDMICCGLYVVNCKLAVKRLESISEVIKEELSRLIRREVELPSGVMLTITRIVVTDDKQLATVFISLLGEDNAGALRREVLEILGRNVFSFQKMLDKRLRVRPVPRIRFLIDEEELKRQRIEELLGKSAENQ